MVFGFILNFQKKFSTNIPKSDTVAKITKILLVKNLFKVKKVFLERALSLFLGDFDMEKPRCWTLSVLLQAQSTAC